MRVRLVVKGLGAGGAEKLLVGQVVHEVRDGSHGIEFDVVFLIDEKDMLLPELNEAGVPVQSVHASRNIEFGWPWRLRKMMIQSPTDIVHVHSPAVAAVARVVARTVPKGVRPVVVGTEHNRWPRHHWLTRLANRATGSLEAATIAVSSDVATTLSGPAKKRAIVILHGIDLEEARSQQARDDVRSELQFADSDVVVMCIANLRREKAIDELIVAADAALQQNQNLRFVLVGGGPMAGSLRKQAAATAMGERFSFLGYRPDAIRLASGADIFTLSSHHEGLPVALMEAMALGIPVVSTAAGGVGPAVGDGGVIVAVGDTTALANAYVQLAQDAKLRSEMGDRARIRSADFDINRAVAELASVYESVRK